MNYWKSKILHFIGIHHWIENSDYDNDWGGVEKAYECKFCDAIKLVQLSGVVYYYNKKDYK